jgi:hypothetical protein
MSSLQECLDRQQPADAVPVTVFLAKAPAGGLEVHSSNDGDWVIPWPHFVGARFFGSPGSDRIVLTFTEHEVVVEGVRLRQLLPEIAGCRIERLIALPPNFRTQSASKAPEVRRLAVTFSPVSS